MTACVAPIDGEIWIADDTDTAVSAATSTAPEADSSIAVGGRRLQIEKLLDRAFREAVAELRIPVAQQDDIRVSLRQAESVLTSLPPELPLPDVDIGSNGRALLEWYFGPRAILTIEVAPHGALLYSVLAGPSSNHGTEWLVGFIPASVRAAFSRLLEYTGRGRLARE